MRNLLVFSDSHGTSYLERLAEVTKFCDEAVFLGDVLEDAEEFECYAHMPMMKVAGNCDFFCREAREIVITIENVKLLICHGDEYSVKYTMSEIIRHAQEIGAQAVLYGHTHRAKAEYREGILLVNPGAMRNHEYAVLKLEDGKAVPTLHTL